MPFLQSKQRYRATNGMKVGPHDYDNLASSVHRKSATRRRRSAQPFNTAVSGSEP
jgi:hypothetical protein